MLHFQHHSPLGKLVLAYPVSFSLISHCFGGQARVTASTVAVPKRLGVLLQTHKAVLIHANSHALPHKLVAKALIGYDEEIPWINTRPGMKRAPNITWGGPPDDDDDDETPPPSPRVRRQAFAKDDDDDDDDTMAVDASVPLFPSTTAEAAASSSSAAAASSSSSLSSSSSAAAPDVEMADENELFLPNEVLAKIVEMADPAQIPTLATSSELFAAEVFNLKFVNNAERTWRSPTLAEVFLRAVDERRLFFVRRMWPLLSPSMREHIFMRLPPWAYVLMAHLFPIEFRRFNKLYIRAFDNARDRGQVDNAILFRMQYKTASAFDADTLWNSGSELPGLAPSDVPASFNLYDMFIVLGRPTAVPSNIRRAISIDDTKQGTNLPALDLLSRTESAWHRVMTGGSGTRAERALRFLSMLARYPDALFVLAPCVWGADMLDELSQLDEWPATLCFLPLGHLRFLVDVIGHRPNAARLFRLACVERLDIALWLLRAKSLWSGGSERFEKAQAYILSRRSPLLADAVDKESRFKSEKDGMGVISRSTQASALTLARSKLYYGYDADDLQRTPVVEIDLRAPTLVPGDARVSLDVFARAFVSPNAMTTLLNSGATDEFFQHLNDADASAFGAAFQSAKAAQAMDVVLATSRVRMTVATARALVERAYNHPALVRGLLTVLGPIVTPGAAQWRAELLLRWMQRPSPAASPAPSSSAEASSSSSSSAAAASSLATPSPTVAASPEVRTYGMSMEERSTQQHAVHALLTAVTPFDFSAVNQRALAMLQDDDRYYLFTLLARQPGFVPSKDLLSAAWARGQLAFVDLWIKDGRIPAQMTSSVERMRLAQMKAMLYGVSL